VRGFDEDPLLAGSFSRQVPRPSASAVTRHYLGLWVASRLEPRKISLDGTRPLAVARPPERLELCAFDDVSSALRRSVWAVHPFLATPIAEDLEWAQRVLLAGHSIAYVPTSVVVHSHDRSASYEYQRTRDLHAKLGELFELRSIPSWSALATAVWRSLSLHRELWQRDGPARRPALRERLRFVALAFAWPLGQYRGGAVAARRRLREAHRERGAES